MKRSNHCLRHAVLLLSCCQVQIGYVVAGITVFYQHELHRQSFFVWFCLIGLSAILFFKILFTVLLGISSFVIPCFYLLHNVRVSHELLKYDTIHQNLRSTHTAVHAWFQQFHVSHRPTTAATRELLSSIWLSVICRIVSCNMSNCMNASLYECQNLQMTA